MAQHFGVTRRTVCNRASAEGWQARLDLLVREARASADAEARDVLKVAQGKQLRHHEEMQEAVREVLTPRRLKAVFAALLKAAVEKGDVRAAGLLIERGLGKSRREFMPVELGGAGGLETAADVRRVANQLLTAMADGSLAPEDAQRAASVVEAARRSLETEEIEKRLAELETQMKMRGTR